MVRLRLFAQAKEIAGTARAEVTGETIAEVLDEACRRWSGLAALLPRCTIWLNGEKAELGSPVSAGDEVAVLPPVSGGEVAVHR